MVHGRLRRSASRGSTRSSRDPHWAILMHRLIHLSIRLGLVGLAWLWGAAPVVSQATGSASPAPALHSDARRQSLAGNWKFRLIRPGEVSGAGHFYLPGVDDSDWDDLPVPGHWELHGHGQPGRGLPTRPSDTRAAEGLYRRAFHVSRGWSGGRVRLRFEGVLWGYQVWVNGRLVGAHDSPYTAREFDITSAAQPGRDNLLAVRVTKLTPGLPFDSDPGWAFSGIFRDVWLHAVPSVHIDEVTVRTRVKKGGRRAELEIRASVTSEETGLDPEGLVLAGQLVDPQRRIWGEWTTAVEKDPGGSHFVGMAGRALKLGKPLLWSAESPHLHELKLTLRRGDQVLDERTEWVGLRGVRVHEGVLRINGRPVTLRGVEWHGDHPDIGRALREEHWRRDIRMMKAAHVNTVFVPYHPPARRFIELCDQYGLYVICSLPLGEGTEQLENPAYASMLLARAEDCVARDRNNAAVIAWSVGCERAYTPLSDRVIRRVKELDPTRPVVAPMMLDTMLALNMDPPAFIDMLAAPFPTSSDGIGSLVEQVGRPVIFRSVGDDEVATVRQRQAHWREVESRDEVAGALIGPWAEIGLREIALPLSIEGGDGGEPELELEKQHERPLPRRSGLVTADREPSEAYWQTRRDFTPIVIEERSLDVESGRQTLRLTLNNRFEFTDLGELRCGWELYKDNQAIQIDALPLAQPPRTTKRIKLKITVPDDIQTRRYWLKFTFRDREDRAICEHEVELRG